MHSRDVSTGATFRYLNPIPTRGGRFCLPSQRSHLNFPCGYVPVYVYQLFIVLRLAQRFLALESALQLRKTNCSCPNWMSWKIPKVHLCNIFCGHRRPIMFSSIFYSLPSNNFKCIILTFTVQTDFFSYMRIHCGSWSVLRGILLFLCSLGFFFASRYLKRSLWNTQS